MDREPDAAERGKVEGARSVGSTTSDQVVYRGVEIPGRTRRPWIDLPATFAGLLAALGAFLLLGGLIAAVLGAIGYEVGVRGNQGELSIGGLIAGAVALFVAFLIGGWTAARVARYAGARHGLVTALAMILLVALLAGLGAWLGAEFNILGRLGLPPWFAAQALSAGSLIGALLGLAAIVLGAWLGGRLGDRQRDRERIELVETREAVETRPGGIARRDIRE
jgi:MFS family permease